MSAATASVSTPLLTKISLSQHQARARMSSDGRTDSPGGVEPIAYSQAAARNNAAVVEYCRTSMAALSGGTAGLLGLTGVHGFAFYVLAVLTLWLMLLAKAGSSWQKYFVNRQSLLTSGFFGALFTYVLFWTFIYGMVHVY